MDKTELQARTKLFALRVIKLVEALPRTMTAEVLGKQLLRSATSVAANYRSAGRGRSKAEFIAKVGIALEECDESQLWLELIVDSDLMPAPRVAELLKEADELTAIFVATLRTAKNLKS
jgi:four helix bundle protein